MKPKGHRGIYRPRYVALEDARCPMRRLLEDGQCKPDERGSMVTVSYERQWQTVFKAQRLGYLDADQYLTDAGRAFLALDNGNV